MTSESSVESHSGAMIDALAEEVLETVRATLMVSYRFLDRALWKMPFEPNSQLELLGTDGKIVAYNAKALLSRYSKSEVEPVRDYLHMVCHCIFYHPFIGNDVNPLAWDLACDIVVESACMGIAAKRFSSAYDSRRKKVIDALVAKLGNLSAEKVYNQIVTQGIKPEEAEYLRALFIRDDHGMWYHDKNPTLDEDEEENVSQAQPDEPNTREGGEHDEGSSLSDDQQKGAIGGNPNGGAANPLNNQQEEDDPDEEDQAPLDSSAARQDEDDPMFDNPADREPEDSPDDSSKEEWEDISRQVKVDLETRSAQYGFDAGSMVTALRIANTRKADYRSFLRRFAQLDEELTVNDEEFDLVYYSYGLRLFGNMPLIEPLEYREAKKIRDFVIAIDTSGSVEGRLVRRFVEETYNILKSTESFFTKVNLRIMQCDARVQSDVSIKSAKDFESYMRRFDLKGFGGTDFRPVFTRIDERIEKGEFDNLRGLIYFTDGYGTYPSTPPSYETVFVFADGSYNGAGVPAWAMRLYLDTTQLKGDE